MAELELSVPGAASPTDILHDGALETTEQPVERLLELAGLGPGSLFESRSELIEQAYDRQAERIAYTETEAAGGAETARAAGEGTA